MLDGIRQGRRIYTDLKRQRDALQSLVTEAIDLEEIKNQVGVDEIKDSAASLENELALDQLNEDVQKSLSSSVSRKRKLTWLDTSTEEERLDDRPESQPLLDEKTTSDSGDYESTS